MHDFYIHQIIKEISTYCKRKGMLRLFELKDNHRYQKTYISNHHSLETSHYHHLIPAPCCYYIKLSFQALTLEIVFHWLYARNFGGLLSSLISCYTSLQTHSFDKQYRQLNSEVLIFLNTISHKNCYSLFSMFKENC